MKTHALSAVEQHLWPNGFSRDMWMIVDAARDRRIFSLLLQCHLEYSCLYSGTLSPELKLADPYLVQLDYDYEDTRRLITQAWGRSWGIFLRCDTSLEKLRRHLRGFLTVQDYSGRRLVFRYYDPRVLRVYLPTCTVQELRTVFGPIESFCMEDETPESMLEFGFEGARLLTKSLPVNGK
jgi:hypothetical protein